MLHSMQYLTQMAPSTLGFSQTLRTPYNVCHCLVSQATPRTCEVTALRGNFGKMIERILSETLTCTIISDTSWALDDV